jgi:D-glycero-alpha-D-manno-heptose-7-phosphate kinase
LPPQPTRIINSIAPIRICDNGGWTDTWFAGHGRIFNIAVSPYVQVQLALYPAGEQTDPLVIHAENYGERYVPQAAAGGWDRHPLLEATVRRVGLPDHLAAELHIFSHTPAGASTGTSAAVTVALIGALDHLRPGRLSTHEVAYLAQAIETEDLGQQCGIQDQLCAAYGGINYIDMFRYPHASVSQLDLPLATWHELERRLLLIFLGKAHHSSQVHEAVIRDLEQAGPTARGLLALRQTAGLSRDALLSRTPRPSASCTLSW